MAANKRQGNLLKLLVGLAMIVCTVETAPAQTNKKKPVAKPVVQTPVQAPTPPTGTGTGIGAANGSGIGAATGNGVGAANGSGMSAGSANGNGVRTVLIIRPAGAAEPNSNGVGTSVGTQKGEGTGAATGKGIGVNKGSVTTSPDPKPAAVVNRTYIKEMDGRCYYVTNQGTKRYVARSRCAVY